uniref:ATP synthase subunit a n=1 Tax=Pseudotrapelus sinaitus TaxID=118229 RepID=D1MV79_9SAUR|nr:ATP synthase F0 subunit 6 [Pseudotrapelus sinaitus]BAI52993.1 ATPase subunit 6 [Pseudotrapelus sinaitus]
MMINLFDQFVPPQMLGLKVTLMAMLFPLVVSPWMTNRLLTDRTTTAIKWALKKTTKHFMATLPQQAQNWALILTSTFFLILALNIFGLLPYTFTPTTHLSMNLAMAVPLWLGTVLTGITTQPTASMAHLLPEGTPTPLIPILILIELISLLMRPLALAVRLTANITAGHLLLQLISTATFTTIKVMPALSPLPTILLLLLTALEMAVAGIQAYVFVLLTTLYLKENTYD